MAIYRCSADLEGKILEKRDVVIFDIPAKTFCGFTVKKAVTFVGRVTHEDDRTAHVELLEVENNSVFQAIGIKDSEKNSIAATIYGCPVDNVRGSWPVDRTTSASAYQRCTSLVFALFRHLEGCGGMVEAARAAAAAEKERLLSVIAKLSDAEIAKIRGLRDTLSDCDFGCQMPSARKLALHLSGIDPAVYDAWCALEDIAKGVAATQPSQE
jgi:hypothetical protein